MKPLCFVCVVDDGYQEYLPLFAYFALNAYPDAEVILYYADPSLRTEVRECLEDLRDLGCIDFRPLRYLYDVERPQSLKSLRWVLYDDDFDSYENILIGDVDMLIVRSEPSLRAVRVRHSEEIGKPYSNRVRPGTTKVVGGSHFVRTHAYFPQALPRMLHYRREIAEGAVRLHNEELLYRLLKETFGLPERSAPLQTHHGIHVRAFHDRRDLKQQRERNDYSFRKTFEPYFDRFLELARTERCRDIINRMSRIDSSPERAAYYESAGPGLPRQFRHALELCDELIEERERFREARGRA